MNNFNEDEYNKEIDELNKILEWQKNLPSDVLAEILDRCHKFTMQVFKEYGYKG